MTADSELLARWRSGDRAAGDELVGRHFRSVLRFFRAKLGDDVQDIVQRTFLNCIEASDRYDTTRPFRPFLFAIARHRLCDELRGRHRTPGFDPACSSLADAGATPSELAVRSEEARLLQRALGRLPLDQQIVLEMFYWEGMRGADIAEVLGVSPHTVRSRISRAQQAIRSEIERLADSPALSASTNDGLEIWAQRVGEAIDRPRES